MTLKVKTLIKYKRKKQINKKQKYLLFIWLLYIKHSIIQKYDYHTNKLFPKSIFFFCVVCFTKKKKFIF